MNRIILFAAIALMLLSACIQQEKNEFDWADLMDNPVQKEINSTTQIEPRFEENEKNSIELTGFISNSAVFPSSIFYEKEIIQFFSSSPEGTKKMSIPLIVTQVIACEKAKINGTIVKRKAKSVYSGKLTEYSLIEIHSFQCIETN
ncbi:MAG: hypothetical protein ABIA76_02170 [Candidatus Diapherotrites archaeon]